MLKISASNKCKCAWEHIFTVAYKLCQHKSCQVCKVTWTTSQLFGYARSRTHINSTAGLYDNIQMTLLRQLLLITPLQMLLQQYPQLRQATLQKRRIWKSIINSIVHKKTLLGLRGIKHIGER